MTPSRLRRFLAFFALAAAACTCSTSVQQVKPSLDVSPLQVSFPATAVGSSSQPQTVTLTANTAARVTLNPAPNINMVMGGGMPFTIQGPLPTGVSQDNPVTLSIVFTPTAVAEYTAELVIDSNDASMPSYSVFLTGQGEDASIGVSPMHLGLTAIACPPGVMSARCSDTGSVTITNMGMVNLQISAGGVYLAPASGETAVPPNLTVANQISTLTLFPSDTQTLSVVWEPAGNATNPSLGEVGNFSATLAIKSDDPIHPEVDIPIVATGTPVAAPTACANVLSVTQREYENNLQGGEPTVTQEPVPTVQWDTAPDGGTLSDGGAADGGETDGGDIPTIYVRPGMTITLTSDVVTIPDGGVPMVDTHAPPCTADPDGFTITKIWALTEEPPLSSAELQPTEGTETQLEIDAAGEYQVAFHTVNSLGLSSLPALVNIDAIPRDDLFAQLSWKDGPNIDLDIHLVVDQGPVIGFPASDKHTASLFCFQDCFFFFFAPTWFVDSTADEVPHLLRDDQGQDGCLESIDLVKAPPNTVFRVIAHYYAQNGTVPETHPQITIRHQTTWYGPGGAGDTTPFTMPMGGALSMPDQAWFGVQVAFDANINPTVTQLEGTVGMADCCADAVDQDAGMPVPPGSTWPPDFTQPGSDTPAMCP